MSTPFDDALAAIETAKYHNHRLETHSDTVSQGIIRDLARICTPLARDLDTGRVRIWPNVSAPGDRQRKVDLFIDNVNPPILPRPNRLGIDVDSEYQHMLEQMCAAYTARWHT